MAQQQAHASLIPLLRALRSPGDEAEWTQIIGAITRSDPVFTSRFAKVLIDASQSANASARMGSVPPELICRPEVRLKDANDRDWGRVDLLFEDQEKTFCLLVELKLGAEYGEDQLHRYLMALDAIPAEQKALLAVTTVAPQVGEAALAGDARWLGSVRWAAVFDALRGLAHADLTLDQAWRDALDLLRDQGDFGPMNFDQTAINAWARRDEAERILRYFLNEMAQPALAMLRESLAPEGAAEQAAKLVMRGQSSVVWPWRNQMHVKCEVPAEIGEERFRLQFLAAAGKPYFTVEARYEHPKERLDDDPELEPANTFLTAQGFDHGNDGWGYYWAKVLPADDWSCGAGTLDRLLSIVQENTNLLVESGIFALLEKRKPVTPALRGSEVEAAANPL